MRRACVNTTALSLRGDILSFKHVGARDVSRILKVDDLARKVLQGY